MFNPISQDQNQFIQNYSSYNPNSDNVSMHNYDKCMTNATPIQKKPDYSYKNNTLVENLSDTLNRETIIEYRLNIDSGDRDISIYPDPFQYIVTFGPVVNSNIDSLIQRNELKTNLRNQNTYNSRTQKKVQDGSFEDNELLFNIENDMIINYDNTLKKIFNPYITRDFINVKFIRLDNIVLPRFNALKINYEWKYCNKKSPKHISYIKDDYERLIDNNISYERYIPDPNITCMLLTDRFIMVSIKEIRNNQNLATNLINTNAFTVFPDKPTGLMYWRGNPYYAVRIYDDSQLGNITKLSFEFFGSDGKQITLDTTQISYETTFINNTYLINPLNVNNDYIHHDHNDHHDHHAHHDPQKHSYLKILINKITEIIKCVIIINFDIRNKIKFYCDVPDSTVDAVCAKGDKDNNEPDGEQLVYNDDTFILGDMYEEFNEFVTTIGFINVLKKTKNDKKILVSVNQFIYNVLWFISISDYDDDNLHKYNDAIHNLTIIFSRYKRYVFNILDKLKKEIINLPLNKYFQNHLLFTMGVYEQKLNTKINYRP